MLVGILCLATRGHSYLDGLVACDLTSSVVILMQGAEVVLIHVTLHPLITCLIEGIILYLTSSGGSSLARSLGVV